MFSEWYVSILIVIFTDVGELPISSTFDPHPGRPIIMVGGIRMRL